MKKSIAKKSERITHATLEYGDGRVIPCPIPDPDKEHLLLIATTYGAEDGAINVSSQGSRSQIFQVIASLIREYPEVVAIMALRNLLSEGGKAPTKRRVKK